MLNFVFWIISLECWIHSSPYTQAALSCMGFRVFSTPVQLFKIQSSALFYRFVTYNYTFLLLKKTYSKRYIFNHYPCTSCIWTLKCVQIRKKCVQIWQKCVRIWQCLFHQIYERKLSFGKQRLKSYINRVTYFPEIQSISYFTLNNLYLMHKT